MPSLAISKQNPRVPFPYIVEAARAAAAYAASSTNNTLSINFTQDITIFEIAVFEELATAGQAVVTWTYSGLRATTDGNRYPPEVLFGLQATTRELPVPMYMRSGDTIAFSIDEVGGANTIRPTVVARGLLGHPIETIPAYAFAQGMKGNGDSFKSALGLLLVNGWADPRALSAAYQAFARGDFETLAQVLRVLAEGPHMAERY